MGSAAPRTLVARAFGGGITVGPGTGRTILFGRDSDEVHVCVGADDLGVSRQHRLLRFDQDRWWVHTVGRRQLQLPSGELFTNEDPVPLRPGYTQLFITGSGDRRHLLELYVVGPDGDRPRPRPVHVTQNPTGWRLSDTERVALVMLGRRYLRQEPNPQPLTWDEAAHELHAPDPSVGWTAKRLAHVVTDVRGRLSRDAVPGLFSREVPKPVGNQLNHNLLVELIRSLTLTPKDLVSPAGSPLRISVDAGFGWPGRRSVLVPGRTRAGRRPGQREAGPPRYVADFRRGALVQRRRSP